MKFALSLVGITCLYIIAFKVSVPVAAVMLVAHSVFEYIQYKEMKNQAAQLEFVYKLLESSKTPSDEPHHGNC